ncbi:MAG: serine/threonine-protein kinase [Lysobacterales bacterium]
MNAGDPASWSRAMDAFDALVDLSASEREAALVALTLESPTLASQVRGLLGADERALGAEAKAERGAGSGVEGELECGGDGEGEVARSKGADQHLLASNWPRVPGFRVLAVLGQGGMGEVFLAERETQDFVQRVALKRMTLGRTDASLRERFLRERRILAQLNHPNIAHLLDGGLDADGNPYFAMELIEGATLTRFAHDQALDLRARLKLFIVVCEAVAHAHTNLIVHRDLKPSNVMVDAQGQVKLLDFGIAKLLAASDDNATSTLAMTPAYAAPEQLLGEPISTATDVYSLGVMLYELLVGHLPERSLRERLREAVSAHDSTERPSTGVLSAPLAQSTWPDGRQRHRLSQQLRGDLDQIVLLALRRDPARRYASAQALADDLKRYLEGRPVRARADHWRYRLSKFVRRNAWAMAAATLTFAGLIAATVVALSFASSERDARAVAEAERIKATTQADRATRTTDFVVDLFRDVNPVTAAGGKGDDYKAVELLDAAAQRVNADLSDIPESQAELRVALAESLRHLGRPNAALPLLDAAIPQLRKLPGRAVRTLSGALQARAEILEEGGDLDGGERNAREALRVALTIPDDEESLTGRIGIRTTLAKQMFLRNRIPEALVEYRSILKDRIALLASDDDPALAVDWHNLAAVYVQLERFTEAEAAERRALQLFAKANGADHPRMVWLHNGLGQALLGLQRLDEAQAEIEAARTLALAKLDPEHPVLVSVNAGLGTVASARGDFTHANSAFAEALRIGTLINHTTLGFAELRYGLSLLAQTRYAEAEAMLARGIDRSAKLQTAQPEPLVLYGTVARGLALAHLGRSEEGEKLASGALTQLATIVDKTKPRYLDAARLLESLRRHRALQAAMQSPLRASADQATS